MRMIEMPSSISDPILKCPQLEIPVGDESSSRASLVETSPSQKLKTALNILKADGNNQEENSWQILQCSAHLPLWDYRKSQRTELGLQDAPYSIENEEKVSEAILNKFQYHKSQALALTPEIVFDVSAHWVKEQSFVCIHLKAISSRKKMGARILAFLCEYLPKVLENEIKTS